MFARCARPQRTRLIISFCVACSQLRTYLSTHGTTRRGKDQRHKDDVMEDGEAGPPRKCPRILNDWTKAQPHIDKNNRWRQDILAIEERFTTQSFPTRLMDTMIIGTSIGSAWSMFQFFVDEDLYTALSPSLSKQWRSMACRIRGIATTRRRERSLSRQRRPRHSHHCRLPWLQRCTSRSPSLTSRDGLAPPARVVGSAMWQLASAVVSARRHSASCRSIPPRRSEKASSRRAHAWQRIVATRWVPAAQQHRPLSSARRK